MLSLNFDPFPELETERLLLRRFTMEYAESMLEMRSNDDVMRYIERPRPSDLHDIYTLLKSNNELVENNEGIPWVIVMKSDLRMVGSIGFWRMQKEHYRAEIGYMLLPEYWKKGIASEAMSEVMRYAFDEMKLHRIEADVNPENLASCALLLKHGFKREANFEENFFWNGKFLNSSIYAILERTYRKLKNPE